MGQAASTPAKSPDSPSPVVRCPPVGQLAMPGVAASSDLAGSHLHPPDSESPSTFNDRHVGPWKRRRPQRGVSDPFPPAIGTRALFGTSRSASSTDRFATTDSRPRLLRKSNVSRPQPRGRGSRLESVGARGSLHGRIAHVVLPGRAEWSERRFPMATTTVGHAEVAIGHDRLPASEN